MKFNEQCGVMMKNGKPLLSGFMSFDNSDEDDDFFFEASLENEKWTIEKFEYSYSGECPHCGEKPCEKCEKISEHREEIEEILQNLYRRNYLSMFNQ